MSLTRLSFSPLSLINLFVCPHLCIHLFGRLSKSYPSTSLSFRHALLLLLSPGTRAPIFHNIPPTYPHVSFFSWLSTSRTFCALSRRPLLHRLLPQLHTQHQQPSCCIAALLTPSLTLIYVRRVSITPPQRLYSCPPPTPTPPIHHHTES